MSSTTRYAKQFIRRAYFEAQGRICGICGQRIAEKGSRSGKAVNLDHVWPRSKIEGLNEVKAAHGNLLLCHEQCNTAKADRLPTESEIIFLYLVNRRLGLPIEETARWDQVAHNAENGANENEPEQEQRGDAAEGRAA